MAQQIKHLPGRHVDQNPDNASSPEHRRQRQGIPKVSGQLDQLQLLRFRCSKKPCFNKGKSFKPPKPLTCACLPEKCGNGRNLAVISSFTLVAHTGPKDTVLALEDTTLIRLGEKQSLWGHSEVIGHPLRAPAYGAPVADPVLKVSKIPADVLRHV